VPLVQFADKTRAISATGLDLLGLDGVQPPDSLLQTLASFDHIVSWYGSSRPQFQDALRLINPNCLFLPALPSQRYAGHAVDFHSEAVGAPHGLNPTIGATETVRRSTIVIHPFSGGRKKNWPLGRYEELSKRVPYETEWTAGPDEPLPTATRFDDLKKLASWMYGAAAYIGNDSGISHLAAALSIPTIALFGTSDPKIWAPRGKHVSIIARESIDQISVDDVIESLGQLFGKRT
jgi:hypothetical protein